jgi:Zn-dependent membrane protease YugP
MPWFYWDPTYIIILPAIIFAMIAQINVSSTFNRYKEVKNSRGFTGCEDARRILDDNGLTNVAIEHISGDLTDHYDPRANVIRLSNSVYSSTSVAAIGVAAHEVGHAIQHATDYSPIKVRTAIIPFTQIGSKLSIPLVILGLIFHGQILITIGIMLYALVVAFQAVTLPVEFNASSRALKTLRDNYILEDDELSKSKKVLRAAAMTYVAALFSSLMSLLRLILLANRRNN